MGITYGIIAKDAKCDEVDKMIWDITESNEEDASIQILIMGGEDQAMSISNDKRQIMIFEAQDLPTQEKLDIINDLAKYTDVRILHTSESKNA